MKLYEANSITTISADTAKTYEYLQARVTPAEKEAVTVHAEARGESLNAFMRRAFRETMERDKASEKFDPK